MDGAVILRRQQVRDALEGLNDETVTENAVKAVTLPIKSELFPRPPNGGVGGGAA